VFTDIAELGDLSFGLSRKEFDAFTQNINIDAYVMGALRRDAIKLPLNFLDDDPTHDHLTGLMKAMVTEPPPTDGYKLTSPTGMIYVMSGQVQAVQIKYPADGKIAADVTLRMSGKMTMAGVIIG
jgi:hypothetical protein